MFLVKLSEVTLMGSVAATEAIKLILTAADPAPPYFSPLIRAARLHAMRDGRCVEVKGGHHLHMEQAAEVAAVLRPFLVGQA